MVLSHTGRPGGLRPGSQPGEGRAREGGETLIELMVAVLIMGTAIVTLLGAITTMILTAGVHRGYVRTGNEATTVAELIQNATYVSCTSSVTPSYASAYASPAYVIPTGYSLTVSAVTFLPSRGGAATDPPFVVPTAFSSTCPAAGDQGTQKLTVTVKAPKRDGGVSSKVTITKERPS